MATKKNDDIKSTERKPKSNRTSRKADALVDGILEGKSGKKSKKGETEKPSGLINDGKCCRCTFRNDEKTCKNPNSEKSGKHVPRKFGCKNFKRK